MPSRRRRLAELREQGLVLQDATPANDMSTTRRWSLGPSPGPTYDVVLVAVRRDLMLTTLPLLAGVDAHVMLFGNAAGVLADEGADS